MRKPGLLWAAHRAHSPITTLSVVTPYLVQRFRIGPRLPSVYAQHTIYSLVLTHFLTPIDPFFYSITHQLFVSPESSPKFPEHSPKVTENSSEHCAQHYSVYTLQYFELCRYLLRLFGVKYALDTIVSPVLPYFHLLLATFFSYAQHQSLLKVHRNF